MTNDWDDDGEFENLANLVIDDSDLQSKDPFDLSKALEGAALEHLHPDKKRFILHSEFDCSWWENAKSPEKCPTRDFGHTRDHNLPHTHTPPHSL